MENWRGAYYLSSPEKGGLFEGGGGWVDFTEWKIKLLGDTPKRKDIKISNVYNFNLPQDDDHQLMY